MISLYSHCYNLKEVPVIDPSGCTDIRSAFYRCYELRKFGGFKQFKNKLTYSSNAFNECFSLEEFPSGFMVDYNSIGTYADAEMYNCWNLKSIPDIDMSGFTQYHANYDNFFTNCENIETVGNINFGVSARSMFIGCHNIISTPAWNMSGVQDATNMFNNAGALQKFRATGVACDIGFYQNMLTSGAIEEIFNNLETVSSKTIDIRRNYGASQLHSDTLAIATSKGWTVLT